jgi:hypothetical protein
MVPVASNPLDLQLVGPPGALLLPILRDRLGLFIDPVPVGAGELSA